jgi:hypothetical protein
MKMRLNLKRQPNRLCLSFAQAMLEHLFFGLDCYIRVLYLKKGCPVIERYFEPVQIDSDAFSNEIKTKIREGYDIFFGICGRKYKTGKLEGVSVVTALWVDLDAKNFGGDMEESSHQFGKLPMPTYRVNSGHGYHGYWAIKPPIFINSEADRLKIEGYLRGMAKQVSGDMVFDLTRMMRLPETINYKDNPVPCYLDFMSVVGLGGVHAEYQLSDFDNLYLEAPSPKFTDVKFSNILPPVNVNKADISSRMKRLVKTGDFSGYKSRSERDSAICVALVRAGCSDDEIRAVFDKYPCGDKYRKQGDAYLGHTIAKARSYLADAQTGKLLMEVNNEAEDN